MEPCHRRRSLARNRCRYRFFYGHGAPHRRGKTDCSYGRNCCRRRLDFHGFCCHHTTHNRGFACEVYRVAFNAGLGVVVAFIVYICRPVLVACGLDTKTDERFSPGRFAQRSDIAGTIFQIISDMVCLWISGIFCRFGDCLVDGVKTCFLRVFLRPSLDTFFTCQN